MQKAFLPVAVSELREKQDYTWDGPLVQHNRFRHKKEPQMGRGHRSTLGLRNLTLYRRKKWDSVLQGTGH